MLPIRPHTFDAGFDPLLNHRPFELCKDPHHPEEGLARRRGSVDALLMNEEINFLRMELGEEIDQMGEGSSQPIHCPYHHHIELFADGTFPKRIKSWTLFSALGSTDPLVQKLLDDRPTVPFSYKSKLAELILGRLSIRRNSGIDRGSLGLAIFHRAPPFLLHMLSTYEHRLRNLAVDAGYGEAGPSGGG